MMVGQFQRVLQLLVQRVVVEQAVLVKMHYPQILAPALVEMVYHIVLLEYQQFMLVVEVVQVEIVFPEQRAEQVVLEVEVLAQKEIVLLLVFLQLSLLVVEVVVVPQMMLV
jgi:hypothetical protein